MPASSTRASRRVVALAVMAVFFIALAVLFVLDEVPALVLGAYGLFSLVALVMYRADKAAAERGTQRTPESSLHAIALVGGWPGALVARQVFRHKTIKQPFRTVFWFTVVANCLGLAWFVYEAPLPLP